MDKPLINLKEYSTKIPTSKTTLPKNTEVDESLSKISLTQKDKHLLENELKDVLNILDLKDGVSVSSNSHIGVANFDNFSVIIEPKILINPSNLFGMINYIFEIDNWKQFPDAPHYFKDNKSYLIEIIILLFVEEVKTILKQGLYKSYNTYQNDQSFLRGKLLLVQNIQNVLKNKPSFACEYDELEYNNLENQILLFCLHKAYRLTNSNVRKIEIRKLLLQMESNIDLSQISIEDFKKLQYNRMNNHYQKAHELSKLIVKSSGIVNFHTGAQQEISSFFVDMNEIFEKFVFKLFAEYYMPNKFRAIEQKKHWAWTIDFDSKRSIRTDILLQNKFMSEHKIVIDTKYKFKLSESDLYQIGFYIHEYANELNPQKIGYAILPKTSDGKNQKIISSTIQGIHIIQTQIDIDEVVQLLENKHKNRKELENYFENLLKVQLTD